MVAADTPAAGARADEKAVLHHLPRHFRVVGDDGAAVEVRVLDDTRRNPSNGAMVVAAALADNEAEVRENRNAPRIAGIGAPPRDAAAAIDDRTGARAVPCLLAAVADSLSRFDSVAPAYPFVPASLPPFFQVAPWRAASQRLAAAAMQSGLCCVSAHARRIRDCTLFLLPLCDCLLLLLFLRCRLLRLLDLNPGLLAAQEIRRASFAK